ncbi:M20/M25/M40 family metallo-hydrolase [Microbacterium sp. NPDC089695]|uniref:M20/M25/M40 family metallo-hydrolase n=1 Tax=Microbacterium sp. NPDC089695 TaxID=3364198 RepID=UPI0038199D6A
MSAPSRLRDAELALIIEDARTLINVESPSSDRAAIRAVVDAAAAILTADGFDPEILEIDGCAQLRLIGGPLASPRVLLLGHLDTVWPHGSLETHPSRTTDGRIEGPGSFDMKVGAALAFALLRRLGPGAAVTLLLTGDEEIGASTSRTLIEETASTADAVLVLEASAPGGALKTRRKGIAEYYLTAEGRAAHAGLEPELGVNATLALAGAALEIAGFGDTGLGTTVTPTRLTSGTTLNTVPASGVLCVDSRAWTVAEQQRVDARMRALRPLIEGAGFRLEGGPSRPPMESASSADLFRKAVEAARTLGQVPPEEAHVGGGSDGNFTAALGVPTLDGLGAVGGGAHADDEHALVDALLPRLDLLERLVRDLFVDAGPAWSAGTNASATVV